MDGVGGPGQHGGDPGVRLRRHRRVPLLPGHARGGRERRVLDQRDERAEHGQRREARDVGVADGERVARQRTERRGGGAERERGAELLVDGGVRDVSGGAYVLVHAARLHEQSELWGGGCELQPLV